MSSEPVRESATLLMPAGAPRSLASVCVSCSLSKLVVQLVQAVKEAVSYSRALASLANDPTLPSGLGPVSVFGGRLQSEGRDLRELFS